MGLKRCERKRRRCILLHGCCRTKEKANNGEDKKRNKSQVDKDVSAPFEGGRRHVESEVSESEWEERRGENNNSRQGIKEIEREKEQHLPTSWKTGATYILFALEEHQGVQ